MTHNLGRHRTTWNGFVGGPGVTTLYWDIAAATPNLAAWNTYLAAIASRLPPVVTLQSQNTGDVLDDVTGNIIGSWTGAAQASVLGTGSAAYSAPTGSIVNWRTAGIVNGHRVRGKTFVVPMTGVAFDTDGTIIAAALTALRNAATAFQASASPNLLVWHRPVGGTGGDSFPVTSADVPDKAAILRSRRD